MREIKAVLFDMDGILYDSEWYYMQGTIQWMRSLGYTGDEKELYRIVGATMERTYQIFYELLDGKYSIPYLTETGDAFYRDLPIPYKDIMFDGVLEILKKLKQDGKKIACCSSSPMDMIEKSLNEMGIRSDFDFIESGDNVPHAKPAPDIYLLAAEALGVKPQECVVYEDSKMGIQAGLSAGMKVIARKDDRFLQDQSDATIIVKDVYEMYDRVCKEDF